MYFCGDMLDPANYVVSESQCCPERGYDHIAAASAVAGLTGRTLRGTPLFPTQCFQITTDAWDNMKRLLSTHALPWHRCDCVACTATQNSEEKSHGPFTSRDGDTAFLFENNPFFLITIHSTQIQRKVLPKLPLFMRKSSLRIRINLIIPLLIQLINQPILLLSILLVHVHIPRRRRRRPSSSATPDHAAAAAASSSILADAEVAATTATRGGGGVVEGAVEGWETDMAGTGGEEDCEDVL